MIMANGFGYQNGLAHHGLEAAAPIVANLASRVVANLAKAQHLGGKVPMLANGPMMMTMLRKKKPGQEMDGIIIKYMKK